MNLKQKMNRLQKAREYKKRRILEETEIKRNIRLEKYNAYQKQRLSNQSESQRQIMLEKKCLSKRVKIQKKLHLKDK